MITIWHNPKCSKSRQTLALLEAKGEEIRVRRYLEEPPSEAELRAVLALLGIAPAELVRSKEALFGELGLSRQEDPDRLIAAMAAHPRLIERPVVLREEKAVLGRPPEAVESLF